VIRLARRRSTPRTSRSQFKSWRLLRLGRNYTLAVTETMRRLKLQHLTAREYPAGNQNVKIKRTPVVLGVDQPCNRRGMEVPMSHFSRRGFVAAAAALVSTWLTCIRRAKHTKNFASSEESVGIATARGDGRGSVRYWWQARSHIRAFYVDLIRPSTSGWRVRTEVSRTVPMDR
jgi:hypothetical protein